MDIFSAIGTKDKNFLMGTEGVHTTQKNKQINENEQGKLIIRLLWLLLI